MFSAEHWSNSVVGNVGEMPAVNILTEFTIYAPNNRKTFNLAGVVAFLYARKLPTFVSEDVLNPQRCRAAQEQLLIQLDSYLCSSQFSNIHCNIRKQDMATCSFYSLNAGTCSGPNITKFLLRSISV